MQTRQICASGGRLCILSGIAHSSEDLVHTWLRLRVVILSSRNLRLSNFQLRKLLRCPLFSRQMLRCEVKILACDHESPYFCIESSGH